MFESGEINFIELLVSYNNYFIERVYIYPGAKNTHVERICVYSYEGDFKYHPKSVYPTVQLFRDNLIVYKTHDGMIHIYDLTKNVKVFETPIKGS